MRFSIIISAAALAGVSFAQSPTVAAAQPSSTCAAEYIVQQCLSSTQAVLTGCATNDFSCMCPAQQAVVTCYNNCPGDPQQTIAQGLAQQYCQFASIYDTTTTAAPTTFTVVSSTAGSNTATSTNSASGSTNSGSSSTTSSGTAAASTEASNGAGQVAAFCASSLLALLTAAFMAL